MIPVTYFSSSSFNRHRTCEMQYLMEYGLGWFGGSNKAAQRGTIVHKVLEICAMYKWHKDNGRTEPFEDEIAGSVEMRLDDDDYVHEITDKCYDVYTTNDKEGFEWTTTDRNECHKLVDAGISGMFDPRQAKILASETRFAVPIPHEWAKYEYVRYNLKGQLELKGIIDLIVAESDDVYEIRDWKTGKRIDWATGKEKTQQNLKDDPQLRIYHYAAHYLYPNVSTFLVTLIYLKDGGAFTVLFTEDDLPITEAMIRDRFNKILTTKVPDRIKDSRPKDAWKCRRLCDAGKTSFENTPLETHYNGFGEPLCKCDQVFDEIQRHGIQYVLDRYMNPEYDIRRYKGRESSSNNK